MKASEHFDLPLEAHQESLYQSDGADETVAEFNTPEQAMIAARAINHADKLAEALDFMIKNNWSKAYRRLDAQSIAEEALKSYRSAE